jgi:NhaP-type Na+/H+ or K+/H+ antiporter
MLIIVVLDATVKGIYLGIVSLKNFFAFNYNIGEAVDGLEGNFIYDAFEVYFIYSIAGGILCGAIMTAANVYAFYQRWVRDD